MAIYDTRLWKVFGEGPTQVIDGTFNDTKRLAFTSQDIRFITRGEILYAILLARPEQNTITIKALGTTARLFQHQIDKIELSDEQKAPAWKDTADGLTVDLPMIAANKYASVLRISPKKEQV